MPACCRRPALCLAGRWLLGPAASPLTALPSPTPAAPRWRQVRAPFALREFASGVKVVQAASHSDEAVCARLAEMVRPRPAGAAADGSGGSAAQTLAPSGSGEAVAGAAAAMAAAAAGDAAAGADEDPELPPEVLAALGPPVTRLEVAMALGVSVAIAGEHLRVAEQRGVLCRDEGPRGLAFYRNFFASAA